MSLRLGWRWKTVQGCRQFLEGEHHEGKESSHRDRGCGVGEKKHSVCWKTCCWFDTLMQMASPYIVRHTPPRMTFFDVRHLFIHVKWCL